MRCVLVPDPPSLRIIMEGNFTFEDSCAFSKILQNIHRHQECCVICFDMRKLDKIDATGLDLIMRAYDMAKKERRSVVFEQPRGQVQHVMEEAARYNALHIAA